MLKDSPYHFHCILYKGLERGTKTLHGCIKKCLMRDTVLLKSIEERSRCASNFRFLDDNNTLKIFVNTTRLYYRPNGNVCKVTSAIQMLYSAKPLIEEGIETFMNIISLTQKNGVSLDCWMSYCSNCVNLWKHAWRGEIRMMRISALRILCRTWSTFQPTFCNCPSAGKSLHMKSWVFSLTRTPQSKSSLTSESSSLGSMINLYLTSFSTFITWGQSFKLSCSTFSTLLGLKLVTFRFTCEFREVEML